MYKDYNCFWKLYISLPTKNTLMHLFQIVFAYFIMLWVPMFLSSLRLTLVNAGFMLGYAPDDQLSCLKIAALMSIDLLLFILHPITLRFRIAAIDTQQEAIRKSRDLNQSEKYNKNVKKLARMENQYASYKRLELNMETIFQMTMSLLLYFYAISSTTTSNSLKAVFDKETTDGAVDANNLCQETTLLSTFYCQYLLSIPSFLPEVDTKYIIIVNIVLSFLSFTK